MSPKFLMIPGIFLAGLLAASAAIDLSKIPPASEKTDVTYEKDIKPIFEASCFRCHGEKEKKGGLRVDSRDALLKGGKEGKVVEVGEALKSSLLISVSQLDPENAMPPKPRARRNGQGGPSGERRENSTNSPANGPGQRPGGPSGNFQPAKPLTPEQVGLVRAWIDQGAK